MNFLRPSACDRHTDDSNPNFNLGTNNVFIMRQTRTFGITFLQLDKKFHLLKYKIQMFICTLSILQSETCMNNWLDAKF